MRGPVAGEAPAIPPVVAVLDTVPCLGLLKGEGPLALFPGPEGKTDHVLFHLRLVAPLLPERTLSWMGSPQTHVQ